MLDQGWKAVKSLKSDIPYHCCINTELKFYQFFLLMTEMIMKKEAYLVDWEKPLYGDPAQDLGHFLAPTTTFWKTDVILDQEQMDAFLDTYIEKVNGRFDTTGLKNGLTFIFRSPACVGSPGVLWHGYSISSQIKKYSTSRPLINWKYIFLMSF